MKPIASLSPKRTAAERVFEYKTGKAAKKDGNLGQEKAEGGEDEKEKEEDKLNEEMEIEFNMSEEEDDNIN